MGWFEGYFFAGGEYFVSKGGKRRRGGWKTTDFDGGMVELGKRQEGREESGGRRVVGIWMTAKGTIGCGGGETGRYFFATGW